MPPDTRILGLATRVGELLRSGGYSLAVAESCTGGLLAAALTDVPGSSRYFLGGVVSYANRIKVEALGVTPEIIATEGAVSAPAAAAMASGIQARFRADIGVSITGVAGPGAEERKPAGLTFIGVAARAPQTYRYQWAGDRWHNRRQSVITALELLAAALERGISLDSYTNL